MFKNRALCALFRLSFIIFNIITNLLDFMMLIRGGSSVVLRKKRPQESSTPLEIKAKNTLKMKENEL